MITPNRFQNLQITVTRSTPEKEQEDENMNLERALPASDNTQFNNNNVGNGDRVVSNRGSTVTTHTQVC